VLVIQRADTQHHTRSHHRATERRHNLHILFKLDPMFVGLWLNALQNIQLPRVRQATSLTPLLCGREGAAGAPTVTVTAARLAKILICVYDTVILMCLRHCHTDLCLRHCHTDLCLRHCHTDLCLRHCHTDLCLRHCHTDILKISRE
jgi:hypothetical protein